MIARDLVYEPAREGDLPVIEGILVVAGQPRDGLASDLGSFWVARAKPGIVAAAGLEVRGSEARLRALCVLPEARHRDVGRTLLAQLLEAAARAGVHRVFAPRPETTRILERAGFEPATAAPAWVRAAAPEAALLARALDGDARQEGTQPAVFEPPTQRHRVGFEADLEIDALSTRPPADAPTGGALRARLKSAVKEIAELQRIFYAHDHRALLLVFQAMDAAGKDSTIRAVTSRANPAGFQVAEFKRPSDEELDHDFLWRCARRLPERGRIGIWNRSHYEEVLVVRVHPAILAGQKLPGTPGPEIWQQRFESIRGFERHLARNGTVVLKFFLNVSREEQRRRFLARLDDPRKHWKFKLGDLDEAERWDDYMHAYQEALRATSRRGAPWYAIPADEKPYVRLVVAETLVETLSALGLQWPKASEQDRARFAEARERLEKPT